MYQPIGQYQYLIELHEERARELRAEAENDRLADAARRGRDAARRDAARRDAARRDAARRGPGALWALRSWFRG